MRAAFTALIMGLAMLAACHPPEERLQASGAGAEGRGNIRVTSVMGPANVSVMNNVCSGRIALIQGSATVQDSCFTGDTNVVVCTDATSPYAVKCAPGKGALLIEGHSGDVISFARVR
jgi:hypothetical protein